MMGEGWGVVCKLQNIEMQFIVKNMSFESLCCSYRGLEPPIPFRDLTIKLELTLKIPLVSPTRVGMKIRVVVTEMMEQNKGMKVNRAKLVSTISREKKYSLFGEGEACGTVTLSLPNQQLLYIHLQLIFPDLFLLILGEYWHQLHIFACFLQYKFKLKCQSP